MHQSRLGADKKDILRSKNPHCSPCKVPQFLDHSAEPESGIEFTVVPKLWDIVLHNSITEIENESSLIINTFIHKSN